MSTETRGPRDWLCRACRPGTLNSAGATASHAVTPSEVLLQGKVEGSNAPHPEVAESEELRQDRAAMVDSQIAGRGVKDATVLAAMKRVPRHEFVPPERIHGAYQDFPI